MIEGAAGPVTFSRVRSHHGMKALEREWASLVARHLPFAIDGSPWRLSSASRPDQPEQGWKLHVSSDILSAGVVLKAVAPYLIARDIQFKAPASLVELKKINCGLFYGFSQVGKCITVYPRTPTDAVTIARDLHKLTIGLSGPAVPYDQRLSNRSLVHYRYGSFSLEMETENGRQSAVRAPSGELVPDLRAPGRAVPDWATDPFSDSCGSPKARGSRRTPLVLIRAFEALSQRGKGGVYRALDLRVSPARLCVLKEGRRYGETDWDGRDGWWRVRHEARVLSALEHAGVPVPSIFASFAVWDHYYLALENIEGENLQAVIEGSARAPWPTRLELALDYGCAVTALVRDIHAAGWVWRDCKPLNLLVSTAGRLRPLDFEGACPVDAPDRMPWGTAGYVPPEWLEPPPRGSRVAEDLYALGATLLQLLTAVRSDGLASRRARRLSRKVPLAVKELIVALLDDDPASRPTAAVAHAALASSLGRQSPTLSAGQANSSRETWP